LKLNFYVSSRGNSSQSVDFHIPGSVLTKKFESVYVLGMQKTVNTINILFFVADFSSEGVRFWITANNGMTAKFPYNL
jgi:hypothetical protein